jgi:hypothetical protein
MENYIKSFISLVLIGLVKIVLTTFGLPLFICLCLYFMSGKRLNSNILESLFEISLRVVHSAVKTIDKLCEYIGREVSSAIPVKRSRWRTPVKLAVHYGCFFVLLLSTLAVVAFIGASGSQSSSAPGIPNLVGTGSPLPN